MRALTQDRLKELFYYNGQFGIFVRKIGGSGKRNKAGEIAGCKDHVQNYIKIRIGGCEYKAHQLAWLYVHGEFPEDLTDHINGNGTDNRISNLRKVNAFENMRNAKLSARNKSGMVGVSIARKGGAWSWVVLISTDNGRKLLYYGKDFFEACCRRKSAELKHGYHANHGRTR